MEYYILVLCVEQEYTMEGTPYNNQPSLAKPNENKAGTYTLIGCLGCAGLLALGLVFVGVIALIGASSPSRPASASPSAVASSHMPEESASGSTAAQPPAEEKKEEPPQNTHTTTKKNTRTVTIEATASGSGNASYGGSGSHNTAKFENSWSYTEEISKSDYYAVSVSGDIFNSDDSQVVTCKLIIDGKVKSEKSATGKYGSAYCSTL